MGYWVSNLSGIHNNPRLFKVSETIRTGQLVMREDTASQAGEVEITDATTAALNALGCAFDDAIYSATQGDDEGLVRLEPHPWAVWRHRVAGGATTGTALGATAPANLLTNTLASAGGTVVTAAEVGTVDMSGGLLMGYQGANGGVLRKLISQVNNTSATVTVPFPNPIAVGDTFFRAPYSLTALAMQLTGTAGSPAAALPAYSEADGSIAYGTGVPVMVHNVLFTLDRNTPQIWVDVVWRTHYFNSLA